MGTKVGAWLEAPWAWPMSVLELAANSNGILPGMFANVTATLSIRVVFKWRSLSISMPKARGVDWRKDPVAISSGRTGVGVMMDLGLLALPKAEKQAQWLLLTQGARGCGVARWHALEWFMGEAEIEAKKNESLDLLQVHGSHESFDMVRMRAKLDEAIEGMQQNATPLVPVTDSDNAMAGSVYGIFTRNRIEAGVRVRV